ncbi:MAG: ATP-binding protein [Candidatus Uhrbacteria bacterium]
MDQLQAVYVRALQTIADAGGIEGDELRPIACPFDPAVPADRLGLAMIAAALHERQRRGYVVEWNAPQRGAFSAIAFPEGVRTSAAIASYGDQFPLLRIERAHADRDATITAYAERIAVHVSETARQPIAYVLTELVANIWDHAETETGIVLAGVGGGHFVLIVVDAGISIPFTYARRDIAFPDDTAAVRAALTGRSARPQGGRGYGIRTSAAIATRGWGGALLLASRHAMVLQTVDGETVRDTAPLHWNGTIVVIEAPLPLRAIDLYAYVEG